LLCKKLCEYFITLLVVSWLTEETNGNAHYCIGDFFLRWRPRASAPNLPAKQVSAQV
jgi:hypothetical protein